MSSQGNTGNQKQAIEKRILTTSYARFDAYRRSSALNKSSLAALTTSSLSLIYLAIMNALFGATISSQQSQLFELLSILVSIFILVLSLIVSFASFGLKSERYFRAGNDLRTIADRLSHTNDEKEISSLLEQYYNLRANTENHESFNFKNGKNARKMEQGQGSEDKLSPMEFISYWLPIVGFTLVTLFSVVIFLYSLEVYLP